MNRNESHNATHQSNQVYLRFYKIKNEKIYLGINYFQKFLVIENQSKEIPRTKIGENHNVK